MPAYTARLARNGFRSLGAAGRALLYPVHGRCDPCCVPYVLASFVFPSPFVRWDLRPYQGTDKATECAKWRIAAVAPGCVDRDDCCITKVGGSVDRRGQLIGLPEDFGGIAGGVLMELQIGCLRGPSGSLYIEWPSGCPDTPPI